MVNCMHEGTKNKKITSYLLFRGFYDLTCYACSLLLFISVFLSLKYHAVISYVLFTYCVILNFCQCVKVQKIKKLPLICSSEVFMI